MFNKIIDSKMKWNRSQPGRIAMRNLKNVFGLSLQQIALTYDVVERVEKVALYDFPDCKIDLSPILEPLRAKLLAKYDARPNDIEWWILTNPTRQYTSSLHPCSATPEEWYGAQAFCANNNEMICKDMIFDSMIAATMTKLTIENRAYQDNVCAMCFQTIVGGNRNSIVFACGHIFHWTTTNSCVGVADWIFREGSNTCPTCRAQVTHSNSQEQTSISINITIEEGKQTQ